MDSRERQNNRQRERQAGRPTDREREIRRQRKLRKQRYLQRKRRRRIILSFLFLILAAVVVGGVFLVKGMIAARERGITVDPEKIPDITMQSSQAEGDSSEEEPVSKMISLTEADIYMGDLILVNSPQSQSYGLACYPRYTTGDVMDMARDALGSFRLDEDRRADYGLSED